MREPTDDDVKILWDYAKRLLHVTTLLLLRKELARLDRQGASNEAKVREIAAAIHNHM